MFCFASVIKFNDLFTTTQQQKIISTYKDIVKQQSLVTVVLSIEKGQKTSNSKMLFKNFLPYISYMQYQRRTQ